jgi:hypothetical protein
MLLTMEGIQHLKADVNDVKRQNNESGLVELQSTYSTATAGLSEYIKQGKDRLTR